MIPNKCASEKLNIAEVRHKIKVSNHSATRLVRFWQKPSQGHCLLSVAMDTTLRCQTETWQTCWMGDYFMTFSPLTPQPPATTTTARPPISFGNIGKWLSEIFFGWKNYSCHHSIGEAFRNSFHPEFPRLTIFLWIVNTSGGWLAQRWRPVTSGTGLPKCMFPRETGWPSYTPQAHGAHFHRLLRLAWATVGLFFFPIPQGNQSCILALNTADCMYISLSGSLSLSLYLSLSVFLSLSISFSVSLALSRSVSVSLSLCLSLSLSRSVSLCLSLALSLSVCLALSVSFTPYFSFFSVVFHSLSNFCLVTIVKGFNVISNVNCDVKNVIKIK